MSADLLSHTPEWIQLIGMLAPVIGATFLRFYSPNQVKVVLPGQPGRKYPDGVTETTAILTKDKGGTPMVVVPSGGSAVISVLTREEGASYIDDILVTDFRQRPGIRGYSKIISPRIDEVFSEPNQYRNIGDGNIRVVYQLSKAEKMVVI